MDLDLAGKKVLITGGSRGIGRGIAKAFKDEGAEVAIVARNPDWLSDAAEQIPGIITYEADGTNDQDRARVMQQFIDQFSQIDILINNLGGSNGSSVMDTSIDLFTEALELNYLSAVHFSKLAAEQMYSHASGSIINISSIFGRESGGKPTYNASKAAMISFTKSFATEMIAYGVRVNGVAPGAILHPTGNWQKRLDENPEKMQHFVKENIPAGRFGTVEEVANVVLFLASPLSSWVVGTTIPVDGGQSRMNV